MTYDFGTYLCGLKDNPLRFSGNPKNSLNSNILIVPKKKIESDETTSLDY